MTWAGAFAGPCLIRAAGVHCLESIGAIRHSGPAWRRKENARVTIKSRKDFWAGLVFVVAGTTFAVVSRNHSFGSSAKPGPGFFPFCLGVLLALLGMFILFESLTVETEDGEPIGAWAWRPLVVVVTAVIVFGSMLPKLGLAISLPVLIALTLLAGRDFHWKAAVLNAVVLTVACWAIFIVGLKLAIPLWPTAFGG
jgi:hypothetical protein